VPDRTDPGSGPVTSQPPRPSQTNRGVTAAGLARRDFPAGLDTSTTWIASPQDSRSAFHQRLAEAIESGIDERRAFSGGAIALLVELVTFADGTKAVYKVVHTEAEVHAEVLSSMIGRAIGARVPEVHQVGRREMYMEFMPGRPAVDVVLTLNGQMPYVETWDGLLLGLLDALIDNRDRHVGNWIIADDGTISGIDHTVALIEIGRRGQGAGMVEPGTGALSSPFARRWLLTIDERGMPTWKDNELHPADVDQWLSAVLELQPHFYRRGYAGGWQTVVGRLRAIRHHAKGPQPWLTTPQRQNSPSPIPTARSSRPSRSPRTAR
jgi:hypothetical protein